MISKKLTPAARQQQEQILVKDIKASKDLVIDEVSNLFSWFSCASIVTDLNKLVNHYTSNPLDGEHNAEELSNITFTYTKVIELLLKAEEQLRRQSHFALQLDSLKASGNLV
jgi:hypothetical protein